MTGSIITTKTIKGPRPYQEDRYFVGCTFDGHGEILAVMDGHGGDQCAEQIRQQLQVLNISGETLRHSVQQLAFNCAALDSGSTLSLVVIENDVAQVAVIGDSPVVIANGDDVWVSPEHNVRSNPAEAEAAQSRGAVICNGYACDPVSGAGLQMSRALGDRKLSKFISTEAEYFQIPLKAGAIVLVCSDGLVDPAHYSSLHFTAEDLKDADANSLIESARRRGLQDNATAVMWRATP